jgi:hypothetical protein
MEAATGPSSSVMDPHHFEADPDADRDPQVHNTTLQTDRQLRGENMLRNSGKGEWIMYIIYKCEEKICYAVNDGYGSVILTYGAGSWSMTPIIYVSSMDIFVLNEKKWCCQIVAKLSTPLNFFKSETGSAIQNWLIRIQEDINYGSTGSRSTTLPLAFENHGMLRSKRPWYGQRIIVNRYRYQKLAFWININVRPGFLTFLKFYNLRTSKYTAGTLALWNQNNRILENIPSQYLMTQITGSYHNQYS